MQRVNQLAYYVMRGRYQAIGVGLLFSVLPLFSWVANVIVGLITLRQGAKEGLIILLWVMLPSVIVASTTSPTLWLYSIVGHYWLSYGLALLLRRGASWSLVLEALLILGLLVVTSAHLMWPNLTTIWLQQLNQQLAWLKTQSHLNLTDGHLVFFARMITGFQVALLFLGGLWNLLVARWLQAALYNPGQLYPELRKIRLSLSASIIMMGCVVASFLNVGIAWDGLPIVALLGGLAGFSLLCVIAHHVKIGRFRRVLFYVSLLFFFPYVVWCLVVLAWIDSILNLRTRFENLSL